MRALIGQLSRWWRCWGTALALFGCGGGSSYGGAKEGLDLSAGRKAKGGALATIRVNGDRDACSSKIWEVSAILRLGYFYGLNRRMAVFWELRFLRYNPPRNSATVYRSQGILG